MMGKHDAV